MTNVFLGYPPESIRQWIENNGPHAEPTTWVEACNPDRSPLSDTEHAEWMFSDGINHRIKCINSTYYCTGWFGGDNGIEPDDWTETYMQIDGGDDCTELLFNDINDNSVIAYRKYTPGHWENTETGEWTDGNWSEWQAKAYAWDSVEDDGFQWIIQAEGLSWGTTAFPENVSHKNANIICSSLSGGPQWDLIGVRTWTSTKDAPSA